MNILEKILEELESLHNKILKDKFAERVTEQEIDSLIKTKDIIRSHMSEKEKVSSAEIISRNIDGKPYYGIKYKKVGEHHYTVGYGSYKLDYVIGWLNEYFEFCEESKVVVNVGKDTNVLGNDGWIPVEERLPEESLNSVIGWDKHRERCVFVQFWNGRWIFGNDIEPVLITAWQPLPEPYREDL